MRLSSAIAASFQLAGSWREREVSIDASCRHCRWRLRFITPFRYADADCYAPAASAKCQRIDFPPLRFAATPRHTPLMPDADYAAISIIFAADYAAIVLISH
jgi:hypothetical protein